jgi:hypothetical protein
MPGCYWVPLLEVYKHTYQSRGSLTSLQMRSHKPSSKKPRDLLAYYMFIPLLTDTTFKLTHTLSQTLPLAVGLYSI